MHVPLCLDQLDGRACLGGGVRSEGRDRLALERRVARQPLDLAGHEHAADARGLLRAGGVDAGQRRVRVWAAQERRVQHSRAAGCRPCSAPRRARARRPSIFARRAADHLERARRPLVERVLLDDDPRLGVAALDLLLGLDQARHDWIASSIRGYVAAAAEVARPSDAGTRRRVGSGFAGNERRALTIWPGVQKPHCSASVRTNASTSGWSRSPSIVVTSRSPTVCTSVMQDRCGTPSSRTVHAPQCPSPQATFVPVRPRSSRSVSGERSADLRLEVVRRPVNRESAHRW